MISMRKGTISTSRLPRRGRCGMISCTDHTNERSAPMLPFVLGFLGITAGFSGLCALQSWLSSRPSRWPGLILPALSFLFSLAVSGVLFFQSSAHSGGDRGAAAADGRAGLFLGEYHHGDLSGLLSGPPPGPEGPAGRLNTKKERLPPPGQTLLSFTIPPWRNSPPGSRPGE